MGLYLGVGSPCRVLPECGRLDLFNPNSNPNLAGHSTRGSCRIKVRVRVRVRVRRQGREGFRVRVRVHSQGRGSGLGLRAI